MALVRILFLLLKGIYGLKQSGRLWNKKITKLFNSLGLYPTKTNNIFRNRDGTLIVGLYVDDLIILSRTKEIADQFIKDIISKCKLKIKYNSKLTDCLGIRMKQEKDKIIMNQIDKIEKLAKRCNITKTNSQEVPIRTDKLLTDYDEEIIENVTNFQSYLGELLYIKIKKFSELFPLFLCVQYILKGPLCYILF